MNIFFLSQKPSRCARWHCDKHVVKMILETTQLLYTAHWILAIAAVGGSQQPDLGTAPFRKGSTTQHGYLSISNPKHPSAIWVRESLAHYKWLCALGINLCIEFRHRFGAEKAHSCEEHLRWLSRHPPAQIPKAGWRQPPCAMPDEYKRSRDAIVCYRIYYKENKGQVRGILNYSGRHRPHWL